MSCCDSYFTLLIILARNIVNKDHDRLAMTAAEDDSDAKQVKRGDAIIFNFSTNVPGWACMSKGLTIYPWGEQEECSAGCFINVPPSSHIPNGISRLT